MLINLKVREFSSASPYRPPLHLANNSMRMTLIFAKMGLALMVLLFFV